MNVSEFWRQQPKLVVVAAAIAVALGSSAQQAQDTERENANRAQAGQSTQVARGDAGMQSLEQYLQTKTLRVSKLVGMEVQSRSGENLGEIEDLVRPMTQGQDLQLIVKTGGIGADERLVLIPFDEIQINADGDELYTNRTREQLAAAPAVQVDRPAASAVERRAADVDRDAANRDAADRGAAPQAGAADQPRTAQPANPAAGQRSTATASTQGRVADLLGAEVIGSGGEGVGEIDDIVISMAGADSIRAVLQVGGIAGIGEKRVAVPMSQLTVNRDGDGEPTVRIAMDQQSLERLPEFEYEEDTAAL